tara:strand:- start:4139 stop:5944 length:1806 start_codon:yes stop_codon:yes gene_type:complete
MTFPTSPTNGDLHSEFGRSYQYVADNKSWRAAVTPAPEINISTVTAFETATDLPLINNNPGDTTFVAEDNSFRLWTGSGWFEIALVNTAPTITTGANATYELNSNRSPTVITLAANDPEGIPIIWGYQVASGSLAGTTVTNNNNGVFSINPGTIAATFGLTFTASDGINIDTSASSFTLVFITHPAPTFTLNNPNNYSTSAGDQFGTVVAISGNYAVVTAVGEDLIGGSGGTEAGIAYIFNVNTGALFRTITNPGQYSPATDDNFGLAASISGNYVLISAPDEDKSGASNIGFAFLYNIATGAYMRRYDNPNPWYIHQNDRYGNSVAISGDYVAVGTKAEGQAYISGQSGNADANRGSGKVYVYSISANGSPTGTGNYLQLDNPNAYNYPIADYFGESVALSGTKLLVGAPGEDAAGALNTGKAYIFDVTTGALLRTISNPNAYGTGANDAFGFVVAMSSSYAMVGVKNEDDSGGTDSGKVYLFYASTGGLFRTFSNPNIYGTSANDRFGESVAVDGNYAVIGAPGEDGVGANGSGKVYIFNISTNLLIQVLDNPNAYGTGTDDNFGTTVGISGNKVIVGAYGEDDAGGALSGKSYIYHLV